MTIFAVSLFIIAFVLAVYALWVRAWLKTKPWAAGFFTWIEPFEIALYKKSETILFARLKMATGFLLMVLAQIGTLDLTPIMPFVPEKYQGILHVAVNLLPMALSVVGWLDEKLRNKVTLPIEIVAVPEKTIAENPTVAATVADAKSTNTVAIAAIDEAKAA